VNLKKEWTTIEEFITSLEKAIQHRAETIRETELDLSGGFERGWIHIAGEESRESDLFVDRFGRVILPGDQLYEGVTGISLLGKDRRKVMRIEPRFNGTQRTAWVCYLEEKQDVDLGKESGEIDEQPVGCSDGNPDGDSI